MFYKKGSLGKKRQTIWQSTMSAAVVEVLNVYVGGVTGGALLVVKENYMNMKKNITRKNRQCYRPYRHNRRKA